jgi:predicted nucleic-acid-binding protein
MKTLSVDTNILLRLLVVDDALQNDIVERLFATSRFFVLWTVLLETEWVLRTVIEADVSQINELFQSFLVDGLLDLEQSDVLPKVLKLHAGGMDFADAAHLCLTPDTMTFVTFDRDLVKRAKKYMPNASVELAERL